MKLRRAQLRLLAQERVLLLDGAMGTLLQGRGLRPGAAPDGMNLDDPAAVRAAHAAYVAAGAKILLTNTFGATRRRLAPCRLSSKFKEINRAGVALAREAAGDAAWVAGDIGPLGEYPEPVGALTWDDAYGGFYEQARVLADAAVDLLLIETISDLREAKAAVMAARAAFDGPVVATMTFEDTGRTVTGTPPEVAAATLVAAGADAVGANCSVGARELVPIIRAMAATVDAPICAQPNAGLPRLAGGRTVFRQTPAQFAAWAPKLVAAGAALVGGCCGTTPEHIKSAAAAVADMKSPRRARGYRSVLASRTKLVAVGGVVVPVVVGERINPTGRRDLTAHLAHGDFAFVAAEARAQAAAGADVVDVNVGGAADAPGAMAKAIRAVQGAVEAPVSVDAPHVVTLEAGLREVVGKPLLNSCPASKAAMARLLPLARKWGAAVVGLPLDHKGVPATAAARLALVEAFITRALDEGIALDDIYVDPLMLTAAHGPPQVTFETLKAVKATFGVRTVLGVSNVSHGLPRREVLNEAAFLYAVGLGLDVAIVNPLDVRMAEGIKAAATLTGGDASAYVAAFASATRTPARRAKLTPGDELRRAIEEGDREGAAAAVTRALKAGAQPLTLHGKYIAPALAEVGRRFAHKECYLPQVIRAAEAAQAAFGVLGRAFARGKKINAGRVVAATVAGDVHDIGKNVVVAVLRSYGFDVHDLGKNVPTARIVSATREKKADVVALSALMTTTMPEMAKVTAALRAGGAAARVLVGGAVVTAEFARKIGATYAADAVSAARAAARLVRVGKEATL